MRTKKRPKLRMSYRFDPRMIEILKVLADKDNRPSVNNMIEHLVWTHPVVIEHIDGNGTSAAGSLPAETAGI